MSTPFGPQLIGETEKTLDALLRRCLQGTGLTEPQWVTLRIAGAVEGSVDGDALTEAVADRAHFADAAELVGALTARGLLGNGRLTDAGREVVESVQATIDRVTAPIWDGLPDDDLAAATRLLNEIISRARAVLG
jgi:hypothetical protein